ncbi:MAG: hypothetical protein Ta2E_11430 [Mycoplasmoidaceae bacterium]|nr:MAG: hypothetical protein Ta2E_11430 [Mycoplasmoidaceae bacterium]
MSNLWKSVFWRMRASWKIMENASLNGFSNITQACFEITSIASCKFLGIGTWALRKWDKQLRPKDSVKKLSAGRS